ncbi:hypothetical protein [Chryseobacterium sp.]|uniref:hypothetical protein n=1 Tax=Chryseobacterium sp. TaxID=1871047 RepID=UPI0028A0CEB5|nr:hypothetical protein [Chryseobacterium sp.]
MKDFTIIRSFYDRRPRLLKINSKGIVYQNKDLKSNQFTSVNKEEIIGLRYGIEFIKGYKFYIGRKYLIFVKTQDKKELKIDFKLFYSIKLQEKHNLYCDVVDSLWENIFSEFTNNLIQKIISGENVEVAGILVSDDKIRFNKTEIYLSDLAIKKYHHYFILHSKQNQTINKMLYYLKDDNAVILLEIITDLIKKYE